MKEKQDVCFWEITQGTRFLCKIHKICTKTFAI